MKGIFRICLCLAVFLAFCGELLGQVHETVLYSFGGYANDGIDPTGGLVFDSAGNIYGTTEGGGSNCSGIGGCGTMFELIPSSNGWTESVLYNFCKTGDAYTCPDGAEPLSGLIFDKFGNLYGTTYVGGLGYGTVFELRPPSTPGSSWTESVLWAFSGQDGDGTNPFEGKLNFDSVGNLYGTTSLGGQFGHGTVFELSPSSNGTWAETILHSFDASEGAQPMFGVAIDDSGNLYGAANVGGIANSKCMYGCGTVFELSPVGDGWIFRVLFKFLPTGAVRPTSSISLDSAGNLYGTLEYGGKSGCFTNAGCGGIFKLAPNQDGTWKNSTFLFNGANGGNPASGLLLDEGAGTGFGTTTWPGGTVYMINGKAEKTLYQFCSLPSCADGWSPEGGILQARSGRLYGVTKLGGAYGGGVVFSISR